MKENENENKMPKKKTSNTSLCFKNSWDDTRPIEEIPPQELNTYLSEFIISVPSLECSQGQQAMSLFSEAVIQGGQISISINTLNQSPTLSSEIGCSPSKRYEGLNVLSDSDSD